MLVKEIGVSQWVVSTDILLRIPQSFFLLVHLWKDEGLYWVRAIHVFPAGVLVKHIGHGIQCEEVKS